MTEVLRYQLWDFLFGILETDNTKFLAWEI